MTSSCSSAAAQYIVGQAGTRQKPRRAFIVGVAGLLAKWLIWARPLSFVAEGWRGGVSHPTPNVAVASDGSPATSDSDAAARPEARGHGATLEEILSKKAVAETMGNRLNFRNAQVKIKTTKPNDSYDIALRRTAAAHRGRFGQRSQEWPSVAQP